MGIVIAFPYGRDAAALMDDPAGALRAVPARPAGWLDRLDQAERLLRHMPGTPLHGTGIDLLRASVGLLAADAARLRQVLRVRRGPDAADLQAIRLLFTLIDDIMLMIELDPLDAASKLRRLMQRYSQIAALITEGAG